MSQDRWWVQNDVQRSDVGRSIFAASGPGVQANDSAPGELALPFGHSHKARLRVPTAYDQLAGPITVEPGVRVQYGYRPTNPEDKQPTLYEFDSTKFSEAAAKEYLAQHGAREYTWLPDQRDQTPTTQGNPHDEGEKPPQGFADLRSFYDATVPDERSAEPTAADAQRAGRSLGLEFACHDIASFHK